MTAGVPCSHVCDGVRVGLLVPKLVDSSSLTTSLSASSRAASAARFRVLQVPAAHNNPAASSKATAVSKQIAEAIDRFVFLQVLIHYNFFFIKKLYISSIENSSSLSDKYKIYIYIYIYLQNTML